MFIKYIFYHNLLFFVSFLRLITIIICGLIDLVFFTLFRNYNLNIKSLKIRNEIKILNQYLRSVTNYLLLFLDIWKQRWRHFYQGRVFSTQFCPLSYFYDQHCKI